MRIRIVAIGMLLVMTAALSAAVQSGNDLYQQGLTRETAGDIKGAIQVFERIIRDFSSNRTLTAKALLQLGRWSELLGQDQARGYYERLIREFANQPEQTDFVAQAKVRLAVLAPTPAVMTVQTLPDIDTLLAVSPDGTKAIVLDQSKGVNIALYDLSKKQTRLLSDLDFSMGYTDFAVWSPDAQRVAYQQNNYIRPGVSETGGSEVRVTTLDGQSSAVFRSAGYQGVQPVGWTPDGATLVVVVARPDKTWAVGTIPASGGRFTPVRSLGWSNANPRLSPDGRFIAYLEGETGLRDVHVVSLDGRDSYRITDDPADDLDPLWSPDSRRLAFTSNRLGSVALWSVEVKDGKPIGQPVKTKDGMQSVQLIDWTDRGIFYRQQTDTRDLYKVPMDPIEGRATGSPALIPYSRTGQNVSPVWSPDGGRLAFVSSAAAQPNRRYVVVMPADGGQPREFLIPTTSFPADLRWFGNGRGLALSGTDTRGAQAVFRLLLETGEWETIPLPEQSRDTRIEWNSDGSAFYFTRWDPRPPGIFERAVNGDAERPVFRSSTARVFIRSLEFSPDRKWLAFEMGADPTPTTITRQILIVDVTTGEARTLFSGRDSAGESAPSLVGWTPTGDLLVEAARATRAAPAKALIVPVNSGAPRPITIPTFAPSGPGETQPRLVAKWSPDGRSIVLGRVSRSWETFVIENPLAAVTRTTASR